MSSVSPDRINDIITFEALRDNEVVIFILIDLEIPDNVRVVKALKQLHLLDESCLIRIVTLVFLEDSPFDACLLVDAHSRLAVVLVSVDVSYSVVIGYDLALSEYVLLSSHFHLF